MWSMVDCSTLLRQKLIRNMPRVSQWDIENKKMAQLIGQLWNTFTLLEDRKEVQRFLSRLFTPTEIQMLAKRVELLKLADSDLEVIDLVRWLGISKYMVYEWLEKHDTYEDDFHVIIDRLKEIDREYLDKLKKRINEAGQPKLAHKTGLGDFKDFSKMVSRGYKKRKKRASVLKA